MSDDIGRYPGGIDPAFIHLVGTIVTWWGRIEGVLVHDLISLRQHSTATEYARKNRFPVNTKAVIKQWASLRKMVFADNPVKVNTTERVQAELIDCAQYRHVIVHYFWPYGGTGKGGDDQSVRLQSTKTKKGTHDALEFRSITVDVKTMNELNERLADLYHRVMVMGMQLMVGPDSIAKRSTDQKDD